MISSVAAKCDTAQLKMAATTETTTATTTTTTETTTATTRSAGKGDILRETITVISNNNVAVGEERNYETN